jgi:hypothetical protein
MEATLGGIVHGLDGSSSDARCPMTLADYRLMMAIAYGEWKRCHALYLDVACQLACGANLPRATVVNIRADVERAMADLASMSRQIPDPEEMAPDGVVAPSPATVIGIASHRADRHHAGDGIALPHCVHDSQGEGSHASRRQRS